MIAEKDKMNQTEFAALGGGEIAYVKEIPRQEAEQILKGMNLQSDAHLIKLFALHAANGNPIAIADSKEAIKLNAKENRLHTVSLH